MIIYEQKLYNTKIVLLFLLGFTALFWTVSNRMFPKWPGVPPVPSSVGAEAMTLGDKEFSFRFLALILQNFGDMGINKTPLKDYNYKELGKWFFLLDSLDPISDHIPMLAAHYFGGSSIPENAAEVVKYLSKIGQMPVGQKWRWLAHAAYLAQHKMGDMDLALKYAYKLQRMNNEYNLGMPQWARQMPAFILNNRGEKEASRKLMENLLVSEKNIDPAEINFMRLYLIEEFGLSEDYVNQLVRMRGDTGEVKEKVESFIRQKEKK